MKNYFLPITKLTLFVAAILLHAPALYAQSKTNCYEYNHEGIPTDVKSIKAKTVSINNGKYDLSWLDKAIKTKKVLMLGENHWMSTIKAMEEDIIFYANEKGSFPVLGLEISYSATPFVNAFINCQPGSDCDPLLKLLSPHFSSKESVGLLRKLQQWNYDNPTKKITVVCTDVEQDLAFTLHQAIVPFFKELGDKKLFAMINEQKQFTDAIVSYMDSVVQNAPDMVKVKDKPYIDKSYLQNVLSNFKVRYNAYATSLKQGEDSFEALFMEARLEQIIRNLTNDAVFGKLIKEHNSILVGGANHMRVYQAGPGDEDAAAWEGWYLAHNYAPTKGKVYSVKLVNLSYNIPETYLEQEYETDNYSLKYLISGYKNCFGSDKAGSYKLIDGLTPVTAALVPAFKQNQDQPVRLLGHFEMKKLAKKLPSVKEDANWKNFYAHDMVIVMPTATLFQML
ncbi:hypothetical protein [uncultured Pontibacter sp.]|uniref:hypothetical protein n=1 Tax=uncultured Pontibacter sp. TaxID=453356 RepID=UPI002616E08E|nr:hypothetical protein [uncultured Pontibacter sp.]